MTLPLFTPNEDPGPNFVDLLRKLGHQPMGPSDLGNTDASAFVDIHATTIVAIRYADGVVMAGGRRAPAGSSIAQRAVEKVHPADRFSGIAIAGSAGFGLELIRLFQLQLEHYEKLEGQALSLEGKATQLAQMVRQHLPLAMQGFIVVPLFAGYDLRRGVGRIYTYDPTGGGHEETDFHADGCGGRGARPTVKVRWAEDMDRAATIELAVQALYEAADEDSAAGGPDVVRGIYPTVATITVDGFDRGPEEQGAERFRSVIESKMARGQRA